MTVFRSFFFIVKTTNCSFIQYKETSVCGFWLFLFFLLNDHILDHFYYLRILFSSLS